MTRTSGGIFVVCCLAFSLPSASSCRRPAPPVAVVSPSKPAVPPTSQASPPTPEIDAASSSPETNADSPKTPSAEPISNSTIAESVPAAAAVQPAVPDSKERILLLAPDHPLIVDFILTIDGAPHTEALNRLVDEVLKLADTNGDGRTMWKELCACDRIKYGQFGNLAISDDNSEKQIVDRYDVARDGVVDRSELPRFLTRNAGSSRPFSIRGTMNYRGSNRGSSPTWRILDADGNGVIDADERRASAIRLAARDTDDDEILNVAELKPRMDTPDVDMMPDRRRRGPDAARLLGPHADWSSVQRSLEQEYGGGRTLRAEHGVFSAEVFAQLDANHDRRLSRGEFERLDDVLPQIVVEVAFGTSPEVAGQPTDSAEKADSEPASGGRKPTAKPRIKIRHDGSVTSGAGPQEQRSDQSATLVFNANRITLATNDRVVSADFAAQAKQSLDMFDQNKDGYLEASEVPETLQGQLGRFEALDSDGDGKAYPAEIASFLSHQQAGLRAQIHTRVGDVEDLLFMALDTNNDQRLDSREIQNTAKRLAELDADGDGLLNAIELPETITIVLARGSIENADALFTPPMAALASNAEKAPRWFSSMDANRDGVVSRREFLGTNDQFSQLDQNQSGLLELEEVPQRP